MDEEQKKGIAVFRFGVIADFVTGVRLDRGEKERLLADMRFNHTILTG